MMSRRLRVTNTGRAPVTRNGLTFAPGETQEVDFHLAISSCRFLDCEVIEPARAPELDSGPQVTGFKPKRRRKSKTGDE